MHQYVQLLGVAKEGKKEIVLQRNVREAEVDISFRSNNTSIKLVMDVLSSLKHEGNDY